MLKRIILPLAIAMLALHGSSVLAQGKAPATGNIEFRNIAEVETEVRSPDGKVEKKRAPAEKVAPGTTVIYTSIFKNIGTKPAGNIVITNPVPANTTLVPASPFGENTDISYSADGGVNWAAAAQVKVKTADGRERPAGISEFTHMRWTYRGDLAAGKSGMVGFRAVVN